MAYIVSALMALVDRQDGTTVSVMQGGPVPEDVKPDHLEHLLSLGLVREAAFAGGLAPTRPGDGTDPDGDLYDDPDGPGGVPAKSANKGEWVDYAVSAGADPAEADAATKDDLIAKYGA